MSDSTGGPAFPATEVVEYGSGPRETQHVGMSLRDYFAAKAIPTAMTAVWRDVGYTPANGLSDMQQHARLAYQMADAMLAERAK